MSEVVMTVPTKEEFDAVDRYCEIRRATRGLPNQEELVEKLWRSGALSSVKKTDCYSMTWGDVIGFVVLLVIIFFTTIIIR